MNLAGFCRQIEQEGPHNLRPVIVRFGIIAFLLLLAVIAFPPLNLEAALLPAIVILSLGAVSNLCSLIWILSGKAIRYRVYFAVTIDMLLITALVHYAGGIEAPLTWVYAVVLMADAMIHGFGIGVFAAVVASLLFSSLLVAEFKGIIPHVDYHLVNSRLINQDPSYLYVKLTCDNLLFFITAVVSGFLSEGLLRSWRELEKTVADRTAKLTAANEQLQGEIRERKQAEEALRDSERSYRLLAENVSDIIWTTDLNLRFTYISPSVMRIRGYSVEEAMEQRIDEVLTPDSLEIARKALAESLAIENDGQENPSPPQTLELEHYCKDGVTIPAEVQVTFLRDRDGRPTGMLGVSRDIREQKRLRQQLLHAQKMESIGTLAGGVAHDFNNLLTVILGHVQMALGTVPEDGTLYEDLNEIKAAGERAAGLTRQLLAFSRKQTIQPRLLDLNDTLHGMNKMLRRLIREDIDLQTRRTSGLWQIMADPGQLEQIVVNLIVNSRDAITGTGRIVLETANVELDRKYAREHPGVGPGQYVVLSVSDTGCGMTKQIQDRIFDPFFTTKGEGKGTGLGLATTYGIVKQHGGNIWVYSEEGQGTTFKVYLPAILDSKEESERAEAEAELIPRGSETILLVEDTDAVRNMAARVLSELGYAIHQASDGQGALAIVDKQAKPPDLLLTDVVMPGMSGQKLAQQIEKRFPETEILLMSGYTDGTIQIPDMLTRRVALLQKPFTPTGLARKVREVLDHKHGARARRRKAESA